MEGLNDDICKNLFASSPLGDEEEVVLAKVLMFLLLRLCGTGVRVATDAQIDFFDFAPEVPARMSSLRLARVSSITIS